jgi:hypothetical protein
MSLLGNIAGSLFRNLAPPILQTAIRAVAPAATNLLKNIVGSGFDVAKYAAPFAVSALLPGPLGALAGSLLGPLMGKGIDALKNMALGNVADVTRQITSQPQQRPVTGSTVSDIVLPALGQVAQNFGASSIGSAIGGAIGNFFGASAEDQLANAAGNLREPSFPGANASEGELLKYQTELQKYARLMDMYSKIIQAHHDMKKGIIANFRV